MWPFKKKVVNQQTIDKFILDWDKVQTVDDLKRILKYYGFYLWFGYFTEKVINEAEIQHLVNKI